MPDVGHRKIDFFVAEMFLRNLFEISLLFSFQAVDAIPAVPDLERLEKEAYEGLFEAQMVTANSKVFLTSARRLEQACKLETLATLYLYKDSGRLTAGFTGVGPDGAIESIYIAQESNFIYMPEAYFDQLLGIINKQAPSSRHQKMVVFPQSSLEALPNLYIQFSSTNVQFAISPRAYTSCETTGKTAARKCVLLVRKNNSGVWLLGKPFTSRLVTLTSIGTDPRAAMKVCLPRIPGDRFVTARTVDISRRLPYTTRDYLLYVALGMVVLIVILWLWSDKLCPCLKRKQQQQQSNRGANQAVAAVVQGTPVTPKKPTPEDQQPLINKV
jgi:hypothetical protein